MDVCPVMQYAARHLESVSSYSTKGRNNSISSSICLRTEEVLILVTIVVERVERDEDGHWEGKSLLMGRRELCELNADHFLAHSAHTQNNMEEEQKKSLVPSLQTLKLISCKKTIKIFPLVRSGCEISNISDMGQTNWHLKGRVNHFIFDPIRDQVLELEEHSRKFLCILRTSTVSDFNRTSCGLHCFIFYLLLAMLWVSNSTVTFYTFTKPFSFDKGKNQQEGNCDVDCKTCDLVSPLYNCGWNEGAQLNFQNGLCWMKSIDYRCLKCLCEDDSEFKPYVKHLC